MEFNFTSLSSEENQKTMYTLYYLLMPVARYMVNSKILINETADQPTHISAHLERDKSDKLIRSYKFEINLNIVNDHVFADFFRESPEDTFTFSFKRKLELKSLAISLLLAHEILHFLLGDVFLTDRQFGFIENKYPQLSTRFKFNLLNIAQDSIINEILIDIVSRIYTDHSSKLLIDYFKHTVVTAERIKYLLSPHLPPDQINRLHQLIYLEQDSWEIFKILLKISDQQIFSGLIRVLIESISYGDFKMEKADKSVDSIFRQEMVRQLINRFKKIKHRYAGPEGSEFNREWQKLKHSKFYYSFTRIYQILKTFALLPDSRVPEDPDLIVQTGYNPVPRICYTEEQGQYQAIEYYVPAYFPAKPDKIILYIDVSGSISDEELSDILSGNKRIKEMYPKLEVEIYFWSTQVFKASEEITEIQSTGGTYFGCVCSHIKTQDFPDKSNIIICSDGIWESFNQKLPGAETYNYYFVITTRDSLKQLGHFFKLNNLDTSSQVYEIGL